VSAPTVDANEIDLAAAKDILARLERYAASVRTAPPEPSEPRAQPAIPKHPMAVAAPADDLLPVAVPWSHPRQPEGRTELPYAPLPRDAQPKRIDPATADLFPYDLAASIVACALIIMAYVSFGRPVALGVTIAIAAAGAWMHRARWFPSVGIKLLIGTLVGLVLVFTA
jgi:hypothetical protein